MSLTNVVSVSSCASQAGQDIFENIWRPKMGVVRLGIAGTYLLLSPPSLLAADTPHLSHPCSCRRLHQHAFDSMYVVRLAPSWTGLFSSGKRYNLAQLCSLLFTELLPRIGALHVAASSFASHRNTTRSGPALSRCSTNAGEESAKRRHPNMS